MAKVRDPEACVCVCVVGVMEGAVSLGASAGSFVTDTRNKTQGVSVAHLGPRHTTHVAQVREKTEVSHQHEKPDEAASANGSLCSISSRCAWVRLRSSEFGCFNPPFASPLSQPGRLCSKLSLPLSCTLKVCSVTLSWVLGLPWGGKQTWSFLSWDLSPER